MLRQMKELTIKNGINIDDISKILNQIVSEFNNQLKCQYFDIQHFIFCDLLQKEIQCHKLALFDKFILLYTLSKSIQGNLENV